MLVRKFISHRLNAYYSQPSQSVVGGVNAPLPLHFGRFFWLYQYKKLYKQNHGQWLTPVELFQPHYSKILLNWMRHILEQQGDDQCHIVELGPGRGTNAKIILQTLERDHPDLFAKVQYTLVDTSMSLLSLQQEFLSDFTNNNNNTAVRFCQRDLMHVAQGDQELLPFSNDRTIVVALEVWDNLPHDKIRMKNGVLEQAELFRADTKEPLQNNELDDQSIELEEVFMPLTDPLIQDVLDVTPEYIPRQGIAWIPSVACGVLRRLQRDRPQSALLIADFDWLPLGNFDQSRGRVSVPARKGEPIITCMNDIDHPCYLQAPTESDILFPTDFRTLATFAKRIWGDSSNVKVYKQRDFLTTHGPDIVKATTNWLSGFSPMTADFDNCSIMTIMKKK
jgi:SAM-dependent MidA family methyltransferase